MAGARTRVTPNRRGTRSREVVLDAAERVMADQGYDGASINAIVKQAGIPISSVYHYFGSKDGVLLAVMERGANRFFADLPDVDQRIGATAEDHLTATTRMLAAALDEHPDFLKLVVVMAAQPPAGGDAAHAHEVVTRVRDLALRRLRKQLAIAFGRDPRSALIGRLARFSLAVIDGAFIATQADPREKLANLVGPLPAALVAMEAAHGAQLNPTAPDRAS